MFELSKLLLSKLCLWPLATSTTVDATNVLRYIVNLIIESVLLIGTFKYALEHIQDIDEATEPAFAAFAFLTSMFIYIWMISKRSSISLSIDQLEFYVNQRIKINQEEDALNGIAGTKSEYDKAEQHYTKLIRRYIFSWSGIVSLYAVILLIVPVIDILHGKTVANNWVTLFKLGYPIEEQTIPIFICHYILDFVSVFIHFTIYAASSAFHMATALYVCALILDMISIMQTCDSFTKNTKLQPSIRAVNVKNALNKAINIHTNVLSLTKLLVEIMSGILFIIIANSIIFLAVCLFQMETKTKAVAFEVYVSMNSSMLQLALIWFFCYYSALVSMRMDQIADVVYSVLWYRFDPDAQNSILMMLRQSNLHFTYKGFGVLQCDMETLKMMINSVVSYYILLKKL